MSRPGMSAFTVENGIPRSVALQWLSSVRYGDGRQLNVRTLRRICAACALPKGLRFFQIDHCAKLNTAAQMLRSGATYEQINQTLGDHHEQPQRKQRFQHTQAESSAWSTINIGY